MVLSDVEVEDYNGIFLAGGPGALEHLDNSETYRIVRQAQQKGIFYGAICISPRILARAGVLKGKKVTGWDDDNRLAGVLEKAKAVLTKEDMVVDDKLITANGPKSAEKFGQTILENI